MGFKGFLPSFLGWEFAYSLRPGNLIPESQSRIQKIVSVVRITSCKTYTQADQDAFGAPAYVGKLLTQGSMYLYRICIDSELPKHEPLF